MSFKGSKEGVELAANDGDGDGYHDRGGDNDGNNGGDDDGHGVNDDSDERA